LTELCLTTGPRDLASTARHLIRYAADQAAAAAVAAKIDIVIHEASKHFVTASVPHAGVGKPCPTCNDVRICS
jgi:hypothetical protein